MIHASAKYGTRKGNEYATLKSDQAGNANFGLYYELPPGTADIQFATASDAPASSSKTCGGEHSASAPLVVSSEEFAGNFTPPDYLIDVVMQRRFLYSLTGNTGAGKTAIALRLAVHVAQGLSIGDYEVEQGRVLYFAGENPDDLRMRLIALSEQMEFDLGAIDIHFIVGADKEISKITSQIGNEVAALGGVGTGDRGYERRLL